MLEIVIFFSASEIEDNWWLQKNKSKDKGKAPSYLCVVTTGEEPATVLGIGEVALTRADEEFLRHRLDLARAGARRRLRRPRAHLAWYSQADQQQISLVVRLSFGE